MGRLVLNNDHVIGHCGFDKKAVVVPGLVEAVVLAGGATGHEHDGRKAIAVELSSHVGWCWQSCAEDEDEVGVTWSTGMSVDGFWQI